MKKMFSMMAVIALLAAMCCVHIPAAAQEQTTVVVESTGCKAGEQVSISVQLQNNAGFTYLEMTPRCPAGWSMTVQNGDLVSDLTKGKQLVWVSDENTTDNGLLATLTFTVPADAAAGEYDIGFILRGCYNYDEDTVPVTVVGGTVVSAGAEG